MNTINKSKSTTILTLLLLLLPILAFVITFYREIYLLTNSKLVLVSYSSGNGSIGGSSSSIRVLGPDYFEEVSIGAEFKGYKIETFFTQSLKELNIYQYNIKYDNSTSEYTINSINFFNKEYADFNKEELENVILDLKNNYNNIDEAYISYLKGSNYYVIELQQLKCILIYNGDKCIHKLKGPSSLCLEKAFLLEEVF